MIKTSTCDSGSIFISIFLYNVESPTLIFFLDNKFISFLFVWGFFLPLENFSLIWRRHHYRSRSTNFYLYPAVWPLSSDGSLTCLTHCVTGAIYTYSLASRVLVKLLSRGKGKPRPRARIEKRAISPKTSE